MKTPFAPSARWIVERSGARGKDFARTRIEGGMLGVPVEGGAQVLKRYGAEPLLSEHGKWRREHLGAWQAAYGRTPYFIHLMPEIEAVYRESELETLTLEEFNERLLRVAERWLQWDEKVIVPGAPSGHTEPDFKAIAERLRGKIRWDHSIFEALFRFGKETRLAFELCDKDLMES